MQQQLNVNSNNTKAIKFEKKITSSWNFVNKFKFLKDLLGSLWLTVQRQYGIGREFVRIVPYRIAEESKMHELQGFRREIFMIFREKLWLDY